FKKDKEFPHFLSEYSDNKRFQDFILLNDSLKISTAENTKAEYFVNLPVNFNPDNKYPLIIVLHGGIGNNNTTYINWDSKKIKSDFISVYPHGRIVRGSYARSYGESGLEDIKEIYKQVASNYPVDTSVVILAGQSAGGDLSLRLAYDDIPAQGLLLAFPVKPKDLDYKKASEFKNKNIRIVMICGEKDQRFFPGQQEMSVILDSAGVENRFIKYPELGHGFPDDFPEQLDKGILYITNEEQ
ncbi:MAG: dienelactone hydrolase family protein, partial [Bacteroidales bacterium]